MGKACGLCVLRALGLDLRGNRGAIESFCSGSYIDFRQSTLLAWHLNP